jgi:hypothetical protein
MAFFSQKIAFFSQKNGLFLANSQENKIAIKKIEKDDKANNIKGPLV